MCSYFYCSIKKFKPMTLKAIAWLSLLWTMLLRCDFYPLWNFFWTEIVREFGKTKELWWEVTSEEALTPNWMPEIRTPQVEGMTRPRRTSGGGEVPGRNNGFKTRRQGAVCVVIWCWLYPGLRLRERVSHPSQCLKAGKEWNSSRGLRGAVGSRAALWY